MPERILLILENMANRNLLQQWIQARYEVVLFDGPDSLEREFDLGIVDGLALKRFYDPILKRKDSAGSAFLPILLIASKANIHQFFKSRLLGVLDEVIFTPMEKIELAMRIGNLMQIRRLSLETLRLAITDPLTHLYNRRHFFAMAERELARLRRSAVNAGILMMDIDHFKQVNDTYGHAAGDRVLEEVAGCIAGAVRKYDIAARYGGEEFVLFLPDVDIDKARQISERIRTQVASLSIRLEGQRELSVTLSIGCTDIQPDDPDIHAAIERADQALYEAKRTGRNRVVSIAARSLI